MKRLALILCLACAVPALAQDALDASTPAVAVVAAPTRDAAPTPPAAPALDNPGSFIKVIFSSVKDGNWWAAAAALLVLVVGLLRTYGKKLHELLPNNLIWDVPLAFLFDTKPGGWLLNVLTAVAGGCGTALLAGEPITWALVKPVLAVAGGGAVFWELAKDFWAWLKVKATPVSAPAAK